MDKKREIGERIKSLRKQMGLSQEELADKADYKNRSSIARIENGSTDIPAEKLRLLADILQTTTFFIETGIDFNDYAFDWVAIEESERACEDRISEIRGMFSRLSEAGQKKVVEFTEYLLDLEIKTEEMLL